jgi:hypothetical protein
LSDAVGAGCSKVVGEDFTGVTSRWLVSVALHFRASNIARRALSLRADSLQVQVIDETRAVLYATDAPC